MPAAERRAPLPGLTISQDVEAARHAGNFEKLGLPTVLSVSKTLALARLRAYSGRVALVRERCAGK